jgi:GMP synthase-like glutamine amidotransferase
VPTRLLVVQNDLDKALGRLADAFTRAGVQLDIRSADRDLPGVGEYHGLVVLPGLANPVDEGAAIDRARGAIEAALEARLPVLGMCLGAELLIEELGGRAYPCPPELGFRDVVASPSAADDPLLSAAPERFSVFHAHTFAFEPPSDAEILLTNEVCVQACRHGDTWAVQCHPEASREWVSALAASLDGADSGLLAATTGFFKENDVRPEELERDADAAEPTLSAVGEGIARGFAQVMAEAQTVRAQASSG